MSTFRFNLPVDIPWTLVDSSRDMMDRTFCNKKYPPPFRSSVALYAYEPKAEELPPEYCGRRVTFLKISCSITGYQPSGSEKDQIVEFLGKFDEVPLSDIDSLTNEYFGCYGVLLNAAVFPFDNELLDNVDQYPRIVDFEPKLRDFYQVASETGEVLSTSFSKVATGKSFGSTDSTQNSWKGNAGVKVPKEVTGGPEIDLGGETGQVRTDADQANWGIQTDASRERREGQSTTTQISQMFNLLTGYHAGTNRATFVMLPRPHVLQPTDRRTFVQGLRIIEGIQDFFLVVMRPKDQDRMKVDILLHTGHFPENVDIPVPSTEAKYDFLEFDVPITDSVTGEGEQTIFGDGYVVKNMVKKRDVVDEANGWEADPTKGDPGRGGVKEFRQKTKVTITEVDTETGEVLGTREESVPAESGKIEDVEYEIRDGDLIVTATLKASRKSLLGSYGIARFSRTYRVFLRRPKENAPTPVADAAGLLVTQRSLCAQIRFGPCIERIPLPGEVEIVFDPDFPIVGESPFDLADVFKVPELGRIDPRSPGIGYARKKAILRKIQATLLASGSAPSRYPVGTVGFLQSRHFQRRLAKMLPEKILAGPANRFEGFDAGARSAIPDRITVREVLVDRAVGLGRKLSVSSREARALRMRLFPTRRPE